MAKKMLKIVFLGISLSGCGYHIEKNRTQGNQTGSQASEAVSFDWIYTNIFKTACLRCHSGPDAAGEIDLSSREAVLKSGSVIPGDPEKSGLYVQVNTGKMPKKKPRLPQDQIDAIFKWIKEGAV